MLRRSCRFVAMSLMYVSIRLVGGCRVTIAIIITRADIVWGILHALSSATWTMRTFIIRLIQQKVKITDIICLSPIFLRDLVFLFSSFFSLCQIVDWPIRGLSPGLGKKLWELERLEKLLHRNIFTLGVKEMTCTCFYLNVMKFSD